MLCWGVRLEWGCSRGSREAFPGMAAAHRADPAGSAAGRAEVADRAAACEVTGRAAVGEAADRAGSRCSPASPPGWDCRLRGPPGRRTQGRCGEPPAAVRRRGSTARQVWGWTAARPRGCLSLVINWGCHSNGSRVLGDCWPYPRCAGLIHVCLCCDVSTCK